MLAFTKSNQRSKTKILRIMIEESRVKHFNKEKRMFCRRFRPPLKHLSDVIFPAIL
jgi:hypothetical protein